MNMSLANAADYCSPLPLHPCFVHDVQMQFAEHSGGSDSQWWDAFWAGCEISTCNEGEWAGTSANGSIVCSRISSMCPIGYFQAGPPTPGSLTCHDIDVSNSPCWYTSDISCQALTECSMAQWERVPPTATSDRYGPLYFE